MTTLIGMYRLYTRILLLIDNMKDDYGNNN